MNRLKQMAVIAAVAWSPILLLAMILALASCGKPVEPKAANPSVAATVPLPRARPAVGPSRQVARKRHAPARVLRVSCEKVRWYHANVPERVILAIEEQDVLLRGLTLAQKAQQRREARACLRR